MKQILGKVKLKYFSLIFIFIISFALETIEDNQGNEQQTSVGDQIQEEDHKGDSYVLEPDSKLAQQLQQKQDRQLIEQAKAQHSLDSEIENQNTKNLDDQRHKDKIIYQQRTRQQQPNKPIIKQHIQDNQQQDGYRQNDRTEKKQTKDRQKESQSTKQAVKQSKPAQANQKNTLKIDNDTNEQEIKRQNDRTQTKKIINEKQIIKQQFRKNPNKKLKKNLIGTLIQTAVIPIIKNLILLVLPTTYIQMCQKFMYQMIKQFAQNLFPVARTYYHLYKSLSEEPKQKSKKVYYPINYANIHGGAKIIMKSSQKIKSVGSILQDGLDKYMYTDEQLPIKIIIGLNEQIAIQSIIIQSYEMYSRITKQFKVQGKFAMEDKKWVYLGTFKAEDEFGDQQFYTQRKIIRYVKLTFLSSYGKWSYFTLTQIKIRGRDLFADAFSNKKKQAAQQNIDEQITQSQSQSHKQQQQERPKNMCQNTFIFKRESQQPHQSNLITLLITKIDNLQNHNTKQGQQISQLNSKLLNMYTNLESKMQQNKFYQKIIEEYKQEASRNYYIILFSLLLSAMTLFCLVCLCWIRRRELIQSRLRESGFGVKKKLSS